MGSWAESLFDPFAFSFGLFHLCSVYNYSDMSRAHAPAFGPCTSQVLPNCLQFALRRSSLPPGIMSSFAWQCSQCSLRGAYYSKLAPKELQRCDWQQQVWLQSTTQNSSQHISYNIIQKWYDWDVGMFSFVYNMYIYMYIIYFLFTSQLSVFSLACSDLASSLWQLDVLFSLFILWYGALTAPNLVEKILVRIV